MESSRYSSKTLQKGSCPYAPLDEVWRYMLSHRMRIWLVFITGTRTIEACGPRRQFKISNCALDCWTCLVQIWGNSTAYGKENGDQCGTGSLCAANSLIPYVIQANLSRYIWFNLIFLFYYFCFTYSCRDWIMVLSHDIAVWNAGTDYFLRYQINLSTSCGS